MSGSSTINTSSSRIESFKMQSSAYGVTVGVAFGVTRVSGNLMWYGGFRAIPHTQTTSGKGGGVKVQSTSYSYEASLVMGLVENYIAEVPRIWRGKKLYTGGWLPTQIASVPGSAEWYDVPSSGPMVYTLVHAATFLHMYEVKRYGRTQPLVDGVDYTYTEDGVLTILNESLRNNRIFPSYAYAVGTRPATAMEKLGITLFNGAIGQPTWSVLSSSYASEAVPYSGIAYVAGDAYNLGTGAQVENHNFEVVAPYAYSVDASTPDCVPSTFTIDVLTSPRYGAGFPAERLDLEAWGTYCRAAGLLMSPWLGEQMSARDFVLKACELTNSIPVMDGDILTIVPRGDKEITANGVTFTPNLTPVYDLLEEDDFLPLDDGECIHVERGTPAEAFNLVKVEFRNRAIEYNIDIAEAKNQASITAHGRRPARTIQAHWICDAAVATKLAHLVLQYYVTVRNKYKFILPWTRAFVSAGDLLRIREPNHVPVARIVRVLEVDEGSDEDDELRIVAEDCPIGSATAAAYPNQPSLGYAADYNVAPGGVATPVFFEAPVERTRSGLEVYAAVKGAGPNWGGCRAWVSLDGTNYREIATIYGPSRYGQLTGPIASGSLPVSTSGQLLNGSTADANALETLCYVGGANPEYLAYTTATLTGPGAYTLSGLVRSAFGTSGAAHSAGDAFVRVDESVAKSGDLDLSYIGRTIHFKFTSFNIFLAGEEALADVAAYTYTVTGSMASLPPSTPTGGTYAVEPFGLRVSINRNPEPDVVAYEWRQGVTWSTGVVLEREGGTSYLLAVQSTGSYSVMVAARDALGYYSAPLTISATINGPVVNSITYTISGPNLHLEWGASAAGFAIAGFEVRHGSTWAGGAVLQQVTASRYAEIIRWGGARTFWVAAIDARGNYGTPQSLIVNINAPGAVTGQRADVVDNNVLLYWTAALGTLPIDRFEVRKGISWPAGTVVGSNGNSTFTAIFEQQAGTYQYWITAYDSANNEGTPVAITATVNQPPDYILRNNFDSTFAGTRTNMYLEAGAMLGPVDTTETWATHFSSRSWASPDSQIAAGYPLYIEPSVITGSYEEQIDYGVVLPSTVVTATLASTLVAGSVTATCTISYKTNSGDPWTVATPGVSTLFIAGGFRYLRVVYDFACTAGANLIRVTGINIRVANRLKTDSGTFTITNAATGVWVPFNVAFLDADTPLLQPAGTTPLWPAVDFSDVPNPTGFWAILYNTSGVRVTGSGSWTARGY